MANITGSSATTQRPGQTQAQGRIIRIGATTGIGGLWLYWKNKLRTEPKVEAPKRFGVYVSLRGQVVRVELGVPEFSGGTEYSHPYTNAPVRVIMSDLDLSGGTEAFFTDEQQINAETTQVVGRAIRNPTVDELIAAGVL